MKRPAARVAGSRRPKAKPGYASIRPGQVWLDTNGKRIQAHGGSIITVGDTFYVWLPIRFDGEMACIDWYDEWRIEDYD